VPGRAVSPVFIGRSDQLARAELVLDRVAERDSTQLLIAGEAGVGKSRFVRELAGRATERSFRILQGGCVAIGGMGLPFAPIASALRDDLGPDDREALLDLDPRSFDALAALVPGLAGIAGPDRENYGSTVTTESVSLNVRGLLLQLRTVVLTSVGTCVAALLLLFGAARFSRARYRRRTTS